MGQLEDRARSYNVRQYWFESLLPFGVGILC
jgi:hypothetical protein